MDYNEGMRNRFLCLLLVFGLAVVNSPTSFAADTQAPVLVDWKLLDTKTDISIGDGKLRIEFSISDESSISEPLSSLSSQSTTQQSGFAFPVLLSKVGNVSTYRAEATIGFGKAPGLWRWLLFPLRDNLGNSSLGFGPGGSWPVDVWVYDKEFTEEKRIAADKAAADKLAAELKAKAEIEAARQAAIAEAARQAEIAEAANRAAAEAEAKAAAELKAKQEAEAAASKKKTITCVKGKTVKKVTAVNPKCPAGYKKK